MPDDLPSPTRAVLLDAGGVLLLPRTDWIVEALERLGVERSREQVRRAHYRAMRAFDDRRSGDYAAALVDALGIVPRGAVGALRASLGREGAWDEVAPGAREGLGRLAGLEAELGVVSNSDGRVESQLRRTRVCQVGAGPGTDVGVIVDSTVVGLAKPDPEVFRLALGALGIPAADAVHVGDSRTMDVEGARAAGVTPLHMDPFGDCPGRDHGHLVDLVDLADRLS